MAELSSSIYQHLLGENVPLDVMGAMREGQRSALGQLALQEARRQRQVEEATRARLRQAYAQSGTVPQAAGPSGAPAGAVQETVNTPYSSDLQAMLSQYQQEGADVTPTPGPRVLPGAGPQPVAGSSPMAQTAAGPANIYTPGLIRDLGMIDPATAMNVEQAAVKRQSDTLDMLGKQNDMVSQVARSILMDDTQAGYERGVEQLRRYGIPVDHLPRYYDRRMVEQYEAMSTDATTRLNEQKVQLQGVQEQRLREALNLDILKEKHEGERFALREDRQEREYELSVAQEARKMREGNQPSQGVRDELLAMGTTWEKATPQQVEQSLKNIRAGDVAKSRAQGEAAAVAKPLEGPALQRVNMLMQGEDVVKALQTEFTPEERRKYVGLGGLRMTVQQAQQVLADASAGKADPKFARFAALVALAKQEAFSTAGSALSAQEREVVYGYIPTGKEWSAEEFEQKLTLSGQRLPTLIDRELTLSTTPREQLAERRKRGELPSLTPGNPQAQPLKEFTEADIAEAMRQTKRSRAEVLDLARKTKKYRVPDQ